MPFVDLLIDNDPELLSDEIVEQIQEAFEGWEPAEAALTYWLAQSFARVQSTLRDQAATTAKEAFKTFGQTIVNIPPILPAPATAESTWTMADDQGYTIPDGTLVAIAASGDVSYGFQTVGEVVVPNGRTATEAGEVILQAVEAGEEANGLTADPTLIDSLSFVDAIALTSTTSGGVDAEDEDIYLNRLTEALQLISLSLTVGRDFEIDARAVAGIERALCIPGFDPGDESEDNPLMFTVFPVDADGEAVGEPVKDELELRQSLKIPSGVINHVADPTYTEVDAETEIVVLAGYDSAAVIAAVEEALAAYLSPARWGTPTAGDATTSSAWENATFVFYNEVIAEIDRVQGVDRVSRLLIGEADLGSGSGSGSGAGGLGTADVELAGPAPLTRPGTITVTAA
jgi:hypothetical protein